MSEAPKDHLNNSEYKIAVAELTAKGMSQLGIANTLGISQPTVSRIANRDDVKGHIDKIQRELVDESLAKAKDNIASVIGKYPDYEQDQNKGFANLSLKYSAKVLESVGILPTHAPSFHIQNIYNSNQFTLTPLVAKLLEAHHKMLLQPPPEDIEVNYEGDE